MKKIKYLLLLSSMILFILCKPPKEKPIQKNIPSLKDVFKNDFLIGASVENYQLEDERHKQLFLKHFNSVTAENCMKMINLYPMGEKLDFTEADKLVKFATDNNINLRFHTLIWHEQCPGWFFLENGKTASKEKLKERMKNHIMQVMGRYKGKFYVYDVVNEPIDGDQPDGLKRNPYYNILGEEYIELAFRWAREADPAAKLLINEIWEYQPHKRKALVNLVKRLKAKGVPIDGIGMQMHYKINEPSMADFEAAIKAYSELGIIHITELDMIVYEDYYKGSYEYVHPTLLNEQGHRIKDIFAIINKYKSAVKSVTFWGMADDHTWLTYQFIKRNDWPLPFDNELQAKPFYWGMVNPKKLEPRINKVEAMSSTIVVDGVEDETWLFANSLPNISKSNKLEADVKAVWDEKYLYVFVKGNGVDNSKNINISLFVDEKNNKTRKTDKNDSIIRYAIDKKWKNTEDTAIVKEGDGFIFETRVPFKFIDSTIVESVGFNIMVKNGNNVIKWNNIDNIGGNTPKYWGTLKFVKGSKNHIIKYGKAIIDGEKDNSYEAVKPMVVDRFIQGIQNEKNVFKGASANVYALWDEKALYIYAEVNDPVLSDKNSAYYMQDSLEVFVDENNKKTESYQEDDSQIRINYKNIQSFGSTGGINGLKTATKIVNGGYVVEMMIPYRSVLDAKEDTVIGFDLQVNDDQGSGQRDSISKWNDPSNNSWISTSGFGALIFKK